jgi:lipopolysaccharide export system protein LptA
MNMNRKVKIMAAIGWAAFFSIAAAASAAGLFSTESSGNSKEPIEIVADRMVTNNTERWADFTGSVKATQGQSTLTCDALRIYYEGDLLNPSKGKSTQESIQKIVATGRVHIVTEKYTADTERAEHVLATDVMTLTGANSTVVSGKNTLTGSKIVLNRSTGNAEVESRGSERVKAVFHQESKGPGTPEEKKPEGKKD